MSEAPAAFDPTKVAPEVLEQLVILARWPRPAWVVLIGQALVELQVDGVPAPDGAELVAERYVIRQAGSIPFMVFDQGMIEPARVPHASAAFALAYRVFADWSRRTLQQVGR